MTDTVRPFALTVLCLCAAAGAAPLGAPGVEPYLASRDDVIFFEDFEQADFNTHWGQASIPSTVERVADPALAGDASLHVQVPRGGHTGIGWQWRFARMGVPEPEEVYFRYYMRLGSSWALPSVGQIGKLPGIAGTYGIAGWGGRPSDGYDGWSARMSNYDRGGALEMSFYCYHADMTGIYGNNWTWGSDALVRRDRWYCIEVYGKMNTITDGVGNHDGVLRGWVDGELAFEKTDIRFRHVPWLKIESAWFNVYVGGSWTAAWDMDAWFDNMVIARDYIGPIVPVGDANLDGAVGIADLSAVADNYGLEEGATWERGDFNDDGVVGIADLSAVADHYGEGEGESAASVPEPATVLLLAAGVAALLRRRG